MEEQTGKKKRGFGSMDPQLQKEIARKGGAAVAQKYGRDHMAKIGQKGGEAVSRDPDRMRELGKKGGAKLEAEYGKQYFSEIGRKGGIAKGQASKKADIDSGNGKEEQRA